MHAAYSRQAGFSLIETIAALAVSSAIILGIGALIHQNVFFFDHGTHTVDQADELARATEALKRDFAGTRFVVEKSRQGSHAIFGGAPGSVLFITGGGRGTGPLGEEVVGLTVEDSDDVTRLVRSRAAWPGPRMRVTEAALHDQVVLLKGKLDLSFSYSELMPDGTLAWYTHWNGSTGLPHSVRLNLRDSETGADLTEPPEFPIYADAPADCEDGEAKCLSLAANASKPGATQAGASP
jgi:general secretion pathway protein J